MGSDLTLPGDVLPEMVKADDGELRNDMSDAQEGPRRTQNHTFKTGGCALRPAVVL